MVRTIRRVVVGLLVLATIAALIVGYVLLTEGGTAGGPRSTSAGVASQTADGWQVVTYGDAQVELPPSWTVASGTAHGGEGSLAYFYEAATFDPATGPGVRRQQPSEQQPDGGWGGYVLAGARPCSCSIRTARWCAASCARHDNDDGRNRPATCAVVGACE